MHDANWRFFLWIPGLVWHLAAQRELGFTRSRKIEQGMDATVDWYLANQEWCKKMMSK